MLHIYYYWCVDDQYLSPYQTRATWLPWLLRKSRPFVFLYGPLGPLTSICGAKMVIHFHSCIMPHTCVKFGPWAYFSFWSTRGAKKFALGPLGPLTFVLGAKMAVSFHPCNMPHKCAKFGPRGYFSFWVTGEQRNVLRRRKRRRRRRKLDDSRTSMPALARPMYLWCWNKQAYAGHMLALWMLGPLWVCG